MKRFSALSLLPMVLACAVHAQLPDAKPIPHVLAVPLPGSEVSFQLDGRELTRFHFAPNLKRPFWYPVQTTLAPSVVRIGHPHDAQSHRHHYGVWITHSAVSGVNFWDDEHGKGKGSVVHKQVLGLWDGDEAAAMMTLNHWTSEEDQKMVLIEKRHMEVRPLQGAASWLLIVDSEYTAPKNETATFESSAFGLMSARMNKGIGVHDGGGRILNSEGQVNEKEIFHKPARWCDYSGRITNDDKGFAGITLFNHSANPMQPTPYHVRDDGWMCASVSFEHPVEVHDNQPLHVRHCLWVHEGVPDAKACEEVGQKFENLPLPDMNRKP